MNKIESRSERVAVNYVEFSLAGLLRFLSHQELLTLFSRAAARARLPLAYTHGYNPRPKISLPIPKSVGMYCVREPARIELIDEFEQDELRDRLRRQVPEGLSIHRTWSTGVTAHPQACAVEWEVCLGDIDVENLRERVAQLLKSRRHITHRTSKKPSRRVEIDLRSFVLGLEVKDKVLRAKVAVRREGGIRPGELFTALGLPVEQVSARTTRVKIHWDDPGFLN